MAASQWPMLIVFTPRPRTESEQSAARRYRPQTIHARLAAAEPAHPDVPVVQVDRGIAVPGNEEHLVAAPRPHSAGGRIDDTVLVGGAVIHRAGQVPGHRHAAVDGEGLEPGIDDE